MNWLRGVKVLKKNLSRIMLVACVIGAIFVIGSKADSKEESIYN